MIVHVVGTLRHYLQGNVFCPAMQVQSITNLLSFESRLLFACAQKRSGSVASAIVLLAIPLVAIFNTTVMCLVTAARLAANSP